MILPIVAYGHPILRNVAAPIQPGQLDLEKFIEDMWETMYASNGVGLAAPQVNQPIRVFTVDTVQLFESMEESERKNYADAPGLDRKSTRLNSSHTDISRMPSSA